MSIINLFDKNNLSLYSKNIFTDKVDSNTVGGRLDIGIVGTNVYIKGVPYAPNIPLTTTAFGSSPNADGATASSDILTLQPASSSFPGGVSTLAQSFSGTKTFLNGIIGDVTGNFTGHLTGNVSGAASLNVLKSGDTMTGTLIVPTVIGNVIGNVIGDVTGNVTGYASLNVLKTGDTMTGTLVVPNVTGNLTGNVTGNVTGSASLNVLKTGDTMTGTLIVPTVTGNLVGNVNGNLVGTVIGSASLNVLKTGDTMTGTLVVPNVTGNLAGNVTGNLTGNVTGDVTGNLFGNATTSTTSTNFSGSLVGDVTGTQASTVVSTVGGQTSTNVAAATVLANAATNTNTNLAIVKRDGAGGFSMGILQATNVTITGLLSTGIVHNNSSGILSTSLIVNADVDAAAAIVDTKLNTISTAGKVANSSTTATAANTPSTIVLRDGSGNFAAGNITANLLGNATTATTAGSYSGSLLGDVTGTASATVVSLVNGQTASNVSAATILANAATNTNTNLAIVKRDGTGSFSATTITSNLVGNVTGNATTSTTSTNFSGSLVGDVTGTQGATVVSTVGGQSSTNVAAATVLANAATSTNTNLAIIKRDGTGLFSATGATLSGLSSTGIVHNNASGVLSTSLIVNADVDPAAAIVDTKLATISTASKVSNSATTATAVNTPSTIVARDGSGNVAIGALTATGATLSGLSSTGIVHNSAAGLLSTSLIVNADVDPAAGIVDTKLATISTASKVSNSATTATAANTPSTIVLRDGSGNFSAGTITANLSGNATTATTAGSYSGSLTGDVTGTASATVVSLVGAQTAANVAAGAVLANAATNVNTASAIVKRDGSGNFSMGALTCTGATISGLSTLGIVHNSAAGLLSTSLIVNADVSASAAIVDTKLATISTASKVSNSATTAVSTNTASTIVLRDGSGNFTAGTITATATTVTTSTVNGNIIMVDSTSTTGNITKGGLLFLHNYGTGAANTFCGSGAGNVTHTGASNIGIGSNALSTLTSGNRNIVIGTGTLQTTGSDNVYIGNASGAGFTPVAGENAMTRIMNIYTGPAATSLAVYCTSTGLLTTGASSERFKTNVKDICDDESDLIRNLRPVMFNYIGEETLRPTYGLIAEEVNKVFPHLSTYDADGITIRGVAYDGIPIILLKQVQKQQLIIEDMMTTIEGMKLILSKNGLI